MKKPVYTTNDILDSTDKVYFYGSAISTALGLFLLIISAVLLGGVSKLISFGFGFCFLSYGIWNSPILSRNWIRRNQ